VTGTEDLLQSAVRAGIISSDQQAAILALANPTQARALKTQASDASVADEDLRLVGGGNDLFVTIGTLLFMAGAVFIAAPLLGENSIALYVLMAGAIWALAEIVTRQKRMRLSSTVLAVLFMLAIASLIAIWVERYLGLTNLAENLDSINPLAILGLRDEAGIISLVSCGSFIAAAIIYFWRFRVPIIAALIALTVTALAFSQAGLALYDGVLGGSVAVPTFEQIPEIIRSALYVPLLCGIIVFLIAVWLDLRDRERITVWSDCAFWLHVVSAPLLVHPLFIMATGQDVAFGAIKPGTDAVIGLVVLITVFTYVALVIDRRSLLVPTLAYFGSLGVANLVGDMATGAGVPPIALVLIAVGSLIILFGAGWQRIRKIVMGLTLPQTIQRRLPPILV
jgi:hypothetical protein